MVRNFSKEIVDGRTELHQSGTKVPRGSMALMKNLTIASYWLETGDDQRFGSLLEEEV
jgi:hypothetical protein